MGLQYLLPEEERFRSYSFPIHYQSGQQLLLHIYGICRKGREVDSVIFKPYGFKVIALLYKYKISLTHSENDGHCRTHFQN